MKIGVVGRSRDCHRSYHPDVTDSRLIDDTMFWPRTQVYTAVLRAEEAMERAIDQEEWRKMTPFTAFDGRLQLYRHHLPATTLIANASTLASPVFQSTSPLVLKKDSRFSQ